MRADVLVHRALLLAVEVERARGAAGPGRGSDVGQHGSPERDPAVLQLNARAPIARPLPTQEELSELAAHLNDRNRTSKNAQRDCTELFQALYVIQQVRLSVRPCGWRVKPARSTICGPPCPLAGS